MLYIDPILKWPFSEVTFNKVNIIKVILASVFARIDQRLCLMFSECVIHRYSLLQQRIYSWETILYSRVAGARVLFDLDVPFLLHLQKVSLSVGTFLHLREPSTYRRWPEVCWGSRDVLTRVHLVPQLVVPKTACGFWSVHIRHSHQPLVSRNISAQKRKILYIL